MCKWLARAGHRVVVADDLSTGFAWAVKWGPLARVDLRDRTALDAVLAEHRPDAVMHFSANALVGESVADPAKYYENNVLGTINLLNAMAHAGIGRFIFSSTCAIFGIPEAKTLSEAHPKAPINPYGRSKLMIEQMLVDYAGGHGIDSVSLRYFNAAGADPDGEIGEAHDPETHLIPNVLRSLLDGGERLKVFGNDYDTPDGTCVRDYVHVNDLADAHLRALSYLDEHSGAHAFNLGNGSGFSVMEVIAACERVTGKAVAHELAPRRAGDAPYLVADSSRAKAALGWAPQYTEIEGIIRTAWDWHRRYHGR